ncbi:major facilitator superfamily MFS-1 [Fusarium acutatum]|uniref:Major facilitator superfamily MFS-1 n=1 Tax=Fusarium acutatum TaxID=78861 RepID=A0A8H4JKR6_9HYPO|nr:major facilitator superfamily MFS-1 [Fusarium acutatum]
MNFGSQSSAPLTQQEATYHYAPNFTIRPPPDGQLNVGTVVTDLKRFTPLNHKDIVTIPDGELYDHEAQGIQATVRRNHGGELNILSKALHGSVGAEAGVRGERTDEDFYDIGKLRTVYFFPRRNYLNDVIELYDVADYLDETNYGSPVYLITGLKIAHEVKFSMTRGREGEGSVGVGATIPSDPAGAALAAEGKMHRSSGISTANNVPTDFILGIQVMKLHHKKKIFFGKKGLRVELVTRGATLLDGHPVEEEGDNFVIYELDEEEQSGLRVLGC